MAAHRKVNDKVVADVRETKEKYPDFTNDMIGRLFGVSGATVGKILRGLYDEQTTVAAKPQDNDEIALALLELADIAKANLLMLRAICLGLAIIVDPESNSSKPVATALREAARGGKHAE